MNTKRDMAERIAERCGITGIEAKAMVQHTLDEMLRTLVENGRLELRNFGIFQMSVSAPRKARNPRTGETVMVPSRRWSSSRWARLWPRLWRAKVWPVLPKPIGLA